MNVIRDSAIYGHYRSMLSIHLNDHNIHGISYSPDIDHIFIHLDLVTDIKKFHFNWVTSVNIFSNIIIVTEIISLLLNRLNFRLNNVKIRCIYLFNIYIFFCIIYDELNRCFRGNIIRNFIKICSNLQCKKTSKKTYEGPFNNVKSIIYL